jgi:hypothetical protein
MTDDVTAYLITHIGRKVLTTSRKMRLGFVMLLVFAGRGEARLCESGGAVTNAHRSQRTNEAA